MKMKNLILKEKDYKEKGWKINIERSMTPNNLREDCDNLFKLCLNDYDYPGGNELNLEDLSVYFIVNHYNVKHLFRVFELGVKDTYSILSLDDDNNQGRLVGFMIVLQETFDKEYHNNPLGDKEEETLKKIAKAELDSYNCYVNDDIYNIIFYKDGEQFDKAYDFYGKNMKNNGMEYSIREIIDDEKIVKQFIEMLKNDKLIDQMAFLT